MNRRAKAGVMAVVMLCTLGRVAGAVTLPPSCATVKVPADESTPLTELRRRVEAASETDPTAAFALLCTTIPRVARTFGEQSPELAWWMGSLATPLIAYMDKYDEALPVLQFVQPILERRYGRHGEALADVHVAYAWTYFRQGLLAEAGTAWQEALTIRERIPGVKKIELQKALAGLAQVQLAQRDFLGAEATLARAHGILVENNDTVSEAGAAIENALANAALRQERYDIARAHAEEQLRIESKLAHGAAQLVPAYALLGRVFERLDEYEKAETALHTALQLAEGAQGPLQRHHFAALYQLASLLDERGQPKEARDYALRALGLGESTLGASAPRLVPVLQVLGDAEHRLGSPTDALRRFERAGGIVANSRANVERPWLVDYYRDFGALQISLGDIVAAEATLRTGLAAAADDPTLSVGRARLLLDHARALAQLGQPGARSELLDALALLRGRLPESHPAILRVLNELCALEIHAADAAQPNVPSPNAASPHCDEVKARLEQARDTEPSLRAAAYANQSRLATMRADNASAYQLAVHSVAAAESAGTPEPMWQALFQLAQVLRARGATALAIFFGKQSITQVERERRYFVGDDQHFDRGFLRDKVAMYRSVADWLLESGRTDEGLAVLALMKDEELSEFGTRAAQTLRARSVELTGEEAALGDRYARAVQADRASADELARLSALQEAGHISPDERARLQTLLAGKGAFESDRAQRIDNFIASDASTPTTLAQQQRTITAPSLAKIAAGFGADTAFAVYLLTAQHLRILVSAGGEQTEFRIAVDAPMLQRDIGHFLDDISQRRDVSVLSQKLYATIARNVDEFAAAHHAHRLLLWLDGALRYVPVAALHDGKAYLVDKYAIQMYAATPGAAAPGTQDLLTARAGRTPSRAPLRVRGLGVTQSVGGFPALPAVADELCYVVRGPITGLRSTPNGCASATAGRGALTGEGYADAAFTAARFSDLLSDQHANALPPSSLPRPSSVLHAFSVLRSFSVLHIGTHFRLRPGNALRSFLLLGDGERLTLDRISAFDFSGIDVVTLSACETGLGGARNDDGREVEGLSALIQRRGARRVIASLWQVSDASTAELMRVLYNKFAAAHGDAALSLQTAQQVVRARGSRGAYANPYYWAGFTVSSNAP